MLPRVLPLDVSTVAAGQRGMKGLKKACQTAYSFRRGAFGATTHVLYDTV